MKSESIAFGVAGVLFGLIAGWVIGSQQAMTKPAVAAAPVAAAAGQTAQAPAQAAPPPLDDAKVKAFQDVASREPKNAQPRISLGNLYFDAERWPDAINWYTEALKLTPDDVDASTDLGVSLYYANQPDKALAQFDHSLKLNPKHGKTLLNVGIVKAFGKQDLAGAQEAWRQVIELAPNTTEAEAAKRAIEAMSSAHSAGGVPRTPGD